MATLLKGPKMPEIADPTPLPDEQQTAKARKRRLASETKSSGVASTILSAGGKETLGS